MAAAHQKQNKDHTTSATATRCFNITTGEIGCRQVAMLWVPKAPGFASKRRAPAMPAVPGASVKVWVGGQRADDPRLLLLCTPRHARLLPVRVHAGLQYTGRCRLLWCQMGSRSIASRCVLRQACGGVCVASMACAVPPGCTQLATTLPSADHPPPSPAADSPQFGLQPHPHTNPPDLRQAAGSPSTCRSARGCG